MEQLYNPIDYNSSEHIQIKDYFSVFKSSLVENGMFKVIPKSNEYPRNEFTEAFEIAGMDFTETQKDCLAKVCSIQNLEVEGEQQQLENKGVSLLKLLTICRHSDSAEAPELKTLQALKKRSNSKDFKFEKGQVAFDLDIEPHVTENKNLNPGDDIIIYATIYVPFKYIYGDCRNKPLRFFKAVAMLGSNKLSEFRDMIDCPGDIAICKEVSNNPDFIDACVPSKDLYPSAFFFIDGVFYNDFRYSKSKDYSEIIRKWALQKQIGNFTTSTMEKTVLNTLTPRINYPYVYLHKGCCEHIIIFTHMRLLNSSDCLDSTKYPYYSCVTRARDKYCVICGVKSSVWLVEDCEKLPQSQALLCTQCFKSALYIGDKKICNFKAYPYYPSASVL